MFEIPINYDFAPVLNNWYHIQWSHIINGIGFILHEVLVFHETDIQFLTMYFHSLILWIIENHVSVYTWNCEFSNISQIQIISNHCATSGYIHLLYWIAWKYLIYLSKNKQIMLCFTIFINHFKVWQLLKASRLHWIKRNWKFHFV